MKRNLISKISSISLMGIGLVTLAGCMSVKVGDGSKIDYSFLAINPATQEIILTGTEKDQTPTLTNKQIFTLLKGAKQGDTLTGLLQDPFLKHDDLQMEKIPVVTLEALGISFSNLGEELTIGENSFIFAGTGNEDGVAIAYLDRNSLESSIPLEWSFTVDKIQN